MGTPMVRPRPSPATTRPSMQWGRPRSAAAPRASPRASASRMRLLLTRSPATTTGGTSTTRKPSDCPLPAQGADVSGAAASEPEVVAHHHRVRAQGAMQHAGRELLGAGRRHLAREGQHGQRVHAQPAEGRRLLAEGHERRGRGFGGDHAGGMRIEGEDDGGAPARRGGGDRAGHEGLVPPVHAVEVPDRDGRARPAGSGGRVEPDDLHHRWPPRGLRLLEGKRSSRWSCWRSSSRRRPPRSAGTRWR